MANKIMKFISETFGSVRGLYIGGQPWLYATDVCKALGIKNTPQAVAELDDDERMTISSAYSQKMNTGNTDGQKGKRGGARMYNLINEAGLFRLIFVSRKPNAREFQRWVFHEVLPSIRRTGEYRLIWDGAREDGKATRRNLTDTIKIFAAYVEEHSETRRDVGTWIIIFTNKVNKAVGVDEKRDEMTAKQLFEIETCESMCARAVEEGMAANKEYHEILTVCDEKLNAWRQLTK